ELLLGVGVHLRLDPVRDLGAREPPLPADFLARQVATAGQLVHLARVTLQVVGYLLQGHHFTAHGVVPPQMPSLPQCPGPKRPGSSKPLPPFKSCCLACVCWLRPHRRMKPLAASWSNWSPVS